MELRSVDDKEALRRLKASSYSLIAMHDVRDGKATYHLLYCSTQSLVESSWLLISVLTLRLKFLMPGYSIVWKVLLSCQIHVHK